MERDQRKTIGKVGEELALLMLEDAGYEPVETNYRTRFGEIDLIVKKDGVLCFVEVKTRLSDEFGTGREAVDYRKKEHIKKTALCYLKERRPNVEYIEFQVVEISVEHLKGLSF